VKKYIEENNLNDKFEDKKSLELHYGGKKLARLYPELN
jgi:hypothetical protein